MSIQFLTPIQYEYKEVPFSFYREINNIPLQTRPIGNNGGKNKKVKYVNLVSAFDIETTRIHDYTKEELDKARKNNEPLPDNSVMYLWQWCFTWNISKDPEAPVYKMYGIYGRTWDEFIQFKHNITMFRRSNERVVVYDHNLAYEFQFLKGICGFGDDDTFNIKPRQVLKATTGNFEFRCAYRLTNMSLRAFAEQMHSPHQKLELDYNEKRFSYTKLTKEELDYGMNDVYCLAECVVTKMLKEGDNLYSIPLTSTGYVRRDVKQAMNDNPFTVKAVHKMMPSFPIYEELKEAFRGGNTHANRYYAKQIIKGAIHSADRSSSYPAVICNAKFPMGPFSPVCNTDLKAVIDLIRRHDLALLTRVRIVGLRLSDEQWGCPYLSLSKTRATINPALDNGRILSADYLETTITDVDLFILLDEYEFENIEMFDTYTAKYGKMPRPIIDKVIEYYKNKTSLKGVEDMEYFYLKNKNLLNSIYGMMVQDLVKELIKFIDALKKGETGKYITDTSATKEELLEKAEKKGFLNYAWGVWVTAWARYELERGIKKAGNGFIYCDTDSVKYIGNVDWSDYNDEKITESMESGSHAADPKGNEHYMGVFEAENDMTEFITLGAKKYAYILAKDGSLHITVAGVGKKAGVCQMLQDAKENGIDDPLELFKEGYIFHEYYDKKQGQWLNPGGLEAVYNDMPLCDIMYETNKEGKAVEIISNVTLRPSSYTLGITNEYRDLIESLDLINGDDL